MDKLNLLSKLKSELEQLKIPFWTSDGTDISIESNFQDATYGYEDERIAYSASILCNSDNKIVYMYELIRSSVSPDITNTKVTFTYYEQNTKKTTIYFDLSEISASIKNLALINGWKFQLVDNPSQAKWSQSYFSNSNEENLSYYEDTNSNYSDNSKYSKQIDLEFYSDETVPLKKNIKNIQISFNIVFWSFFAFLLISDIILTIKGANIVFIIFSTFILSALYLLKNRLSLNIITTISGFSGAMILTVSIFTYSVSAGNISHSKATNIPLKSIVPLKAEVDKEKPFIIIEGYAKSIEDKSLKPLNKSNSFKLSDTHIFYCINIKHLPKDSIIISKWYFNDELKFETSPNLASEEINNQYYSTHIKSPFEIGKYKTEIIISKNDIEIFKCSDEVVIDK